MLAPPRSRRARSFSHVAYPISELAHSMAAILRTPKIVIAICTLAAAALIAAWAVNGRISAARDRDRLSANGTIEVRDIELSAPRAARLAAYRASEGQKVRAGDVVAVLDTADLESKTR